MPKFLSSGEFLSTACAFTWAIAIMFFRKSGERVTPVALNVFKNTVGMVLFLVTLPILGITFFPSGQSTSDWLVLLLSGAIGIGVADSLFFASLNRLGASNSAIVDCLYSPFVILCAWLYLRESIGLSILVAMAMMAGAILVGTWEPKKAASGLTRKQLLSGIVLGIAAMFLMAVGIVLAKPVLAHANGWWVTTVRLLGGGVLLMVHGMTRRHRADVIRCFRPSRQWLYTVPAAVVGAYIALIMWIQGMKYTFASIASVLNQMSTIFVLILAAVFLKERVTVRKVIAIAMAFAGAVIVAL
ncbi:MAG: DMT family transporter [Deltaproteobacteria bacterium]|nr:DMT family transporter [Deltaproteobacteria bacterium]